VDETEDGDLELQVNNSVVSDSLSQDGAEIAESGSGNLDARFVRTTVSDNDNFGINASEGDAGAGTLRLQSATISGNGDGPTSLTNVTITQQVP
jgi:hypothetical protein